jgi:5'-AMP-activated protein kinase regulatory gamma subunit
MMEGLSKLLQRSLQELIKVPASEVVTLGHNLTVGQALSILSRHGILSAPLVINPDLEEVGGDNMDVCLLGWVDVQDLLNGFLKHMDDVGGTPSHPSMLGWMLALEKHGPEFADKLLLTVHDGQDRALLYTGDGNISVKDAICQHFFRIIDGETRAVHRLAVFDAHGEITTVVSQMDIARWLLQHEAELGAFAERSLEDLGLLTGKPPMVQVNPNSPTLVALGRLAAEHVSGAPVVTDEGELIANLSVSDIRQALSVSTICSVASSSRESPTPCPPHI